MPTVAASRPEARGWVAPALALVLAVTALRWLLLAFDRTDLFVDESQYWLWGQHFEFGYYSKPPLIGWLIGAVTGLAGSDDSFWVRMPAAGLHGVTALILAALAARLWGAAAAIWTTAAWLSLPMVAVASLLISTDTVMAPFFAAALLFHRRLLEDGRMGWAMAAGAMAGMAFLAKYAAIYYIVGVGLAALWPAGRIGWRNGAVLLGAFLVVISPNIVWNLGNRLATVSHTLDNIGWVREDAPLESGLNPAGLAEFLLSQFGVFGPVFFAALILVVARPKGRAGLLVFVLPALAVVSFQALMDRAYANWAASAYLAATPLVVAYLMPRPIWLRVGIGVNVAVALALPLLTLVPEVTLGRDQPLLSRYLGRSDLSREIIAQSKAQGGIPVVAGNRDILADLFYTGRESGLAFYARPPVGRPQNHYEQRHALPGSATGAVLFIGDLPAGCPSLAPGQTVTGTGTWAGKHFAATVTEASCLHAPG
ncbi:ArnT family glycosyltransferase [Neotabrizicola shimadae]|uniref:Glycosyltransferase family 39 protein n=1 Tax=Neotabrizicola shimadae TaxID=2807096 RepID=A0A8G1ECW7_9RHOB|nr:glycosyltransferase family 39 protein [Neotabrizicola shimadae]QYZ68774.1 glycosyltransferase family 39 protein [Neotabrizicola shimadae]